MPGAFRKVLVGPEVTIICSYNPARKLVLIINESETTVYISKDPLYVRELGIPVYPFEGLIFDVADADSPEEMIYGQTYEGVSELRVYEALV